MNKHPAREVVMIPVNLNVVDGDGLPGIDFNLSPLVTWSVLSNKTKGCGSRMATLTMVFKLLESAQKRWQRIHGYIKVEDIWQGIKYQDGIRVEEILDGKIKLTEASEPALV